MTVKVLLVEDDRALREALADTLMLGGYDFREADCAEAALVALGEEPFGMMISDVNMPAWTATSCSRWCAPAIRNCPCC